MKRQLGMRSSVQTGESSCVSPSFAYISLSVSAICQQYICLSTCEGFQRISTLLTLRLRYSGNTASWRTQLIALYLSLSVKSQEAAARLCTDPAGFTAVSGVVAVSNAGVADCNCVRIGNACVTDNTDPATQAAAGFLGGQLRLLSIETI